MYRLAFYLRRPVSELNMSWREFMHWQAYLKLEPPDDGDNQRIAALLAQITNMAGRSLPNNKKVKPEDFLRRAESKPERQSEDDQKAFLRALGGI